MGRRVEKGTVQTPYRPIKVFTIAEVEVERRKYEALIKIHMQDKLDAANDLLRLAEDMQGSRVVEVRRIAARLLRVGEGVL